MAPEITTAVRPTVTPPKELKVDPLDREAGEEDPVQLVVVTVDLNAVLADFLDK